MSVEEIPVTFSCQSEQLVGIVHKPAHLSEIGVLVVVGGPQYRVGSHRQFVLLARSLADNGFPVMRFDYRGMGDAEGDVRLFSDIDEDIRSAIETFYLQCPNLTGVVIWGLCDAASAALFYAYQDDRVKGLVLLNPWVFTEQGAAKTYLKHYYLQRLLSGDFWRKVFCFKFDYRRSIASFYALLKNMTKTDVTNASDLSDHSVTLVDPSLSLPLRMRECLCRFQHPVLLILSGRDLTADEFRETVKSDSKWQSLLVVKDVKQLSFPEADHTFSSAMSRNKVADSTLNWLNDFVLKA